MLKPGQIVELPGGPKHGWRYAVPERTGPSVELATLAHPEAEIATKRYLDIGWRTPDGIPLLVWEDPDDRTNPVGDEHILTEADFDN
jgi:hypothetical protein